MKYLMAAAVAGVAFAGAAEAATVERFYGDDIFNDLCNYGVSNRDCEYAIGEMRGGDGRFAGEREVYLEYPANGVTSTPGGPVQTRHYAWDDGIATGFTMSYGGASGSQLLTLSVDANALSSSVTSSDTIDLTGMTRMFIRSRSNQDDPNRPGTTFLEDLVLVNVSSGETLLLGDNVTSGGGWRGAAYIDIWGFDFEGPWELTGKVTFDWDGSATNSSTYPRASRLDHNIKLTNVAVPPPAPVPLPATAVLLLAGIGGIVGLRARRRAA